jgi:hypothetical protein
MKLWITTRNLSSSTNYNRAIPSHTLLTKHRRRIRYSKTHLSRRKLWMTTTNTPRKRSLSILRMHLPAHCTKRILRIIQLHAYTISRCSSPIPNYSNSLFRIRTTMRTNIILRGNQNYKPIISNPLCRK